MEENILGKRIKQLREFKDVSQLELSKHLNISNTTLSQYETGKRIPSDEIKSKLADYFNVSIDYLLGRTNEKVLNTKKELYTAPLTPKDERDIEKDIEKLTKDWSNIEGLSLSGEAVSEEALEAIKESIALAIRQAKVINKKYTPKKYRRDNK